jgi:predicted nuclease with TOPRIM domain
MQSQNEIGDFDQVYQKIQQFFKIFEELKRRHDRLIAELEEIRSNPEKEQQGNKIRELEMEVAQLKKLNKTLKEKESLIKNKIDRLAVKLENIDI